MFVNKIICVMVDKVMAGGNPYGRKHQPLLDAKPLKLRSHSHAHTNSVWKWLSPKDKLNLLMIKLRY